MAGDGMSGKSVSDVPDILRRFFARSEKCSNLPGVRIVLPRAIPAAGFEVRLLDAETGDGAAFENSAGMEVVMGWSDGRGEPDSVRIGLHDAVTGETRRRLLSGAPLIARVTHVYEIVSVEEEN
jgi:hypothetical protein